MTRDDLRRFHALDIDFASIGLEWGGQFCDYFWTPVDAEPVGAIGCDGVHFILLPGDERVFCVDPCMGEEGKFVLPVASHFREFMSFVLYCQDANPISQLWWMTQEQFRGLLAEDAAARTEGTHEALFAHKDAALAAIAREFDLTPASPFETVKALQAGFDPSVLHFSDEYYDTLGLERPQ